nr:aldo/keto reductase [uncultured Cohaesibacter sp.]
MSIDRTNILSLPKRTLGQNGPTVSALALGTMTFGAETDEQTAHLQLDRFAERGGNLIDTADVYSDGVSERIIGRWGKARGGMADLLVATKCRFRPVAGSTGASRRAVRLAMEGSLRRLGVDAVDLYFIHGWDKDTSVAETLDVLSDLRREGKLHHVGWSNLTGWQLERIVRIAEANGLPVPCALQPQYNLLDRGIELELLPCALENKIGLTPWSPLGGGWLTGKYRPDTPPSGSTRLGEDPNRGVEAYGIRNTERTYRILNELQRIANAHDCLSSHVALQWLLSRPGVSSVLLGARTIEQLESNLNAVSVTLTKKDLNDLTKVSAPGIPDYPYKFVRDWSGIDHWDQFGALKGSGEKEAFN